MKITTLFTFIISLSLVTTLSAQTTLQAGQVYEGGTHLKVQEAGISFKTPIGWNGILPQGGAFFIMTAADQISNIIVSANQMTTATAKEQMNNPIVLSQGLTLMPTGQTTQNGNQ